MVATHRKPQELIDVPAAAREDIQVIKRFSGGGTVVTDQQTLFTTVILNTDVLPPGVENYPRPLMRWSEQLWKPVFSPHGKFNLQENGMHFELSLNSKGALSPSQDVPVSALSSSQDVHRAQSKGLGCGMKAMYMIKSSDNMQ